MAHFIELPSFKDSRGSLTVIEKILPFEVKRIYYIYGVDDTSIVRAGHRHHKNRQALVCVSGSCTISNNDGKEKKDFLLDSPDKCLILDTKDWHTIHSFSKDAVLLALASEYYDVNDYIDEEY